MVPVVNAIFLIVAVNTVYVVNSLRVYESLKLDNGILCAVRGPDGRHIG